ncbi:TrbC/VirB2 family protein [Calidithermus chliarophilus]|jgi:type IV secretory pathway VirB2 component (pilin)|uniref:TrbC/VirB2 family protein n=1 Tax=Calidithermus chliarophilus TaxID=52023 RepID=UPI0004839A47|nr:TrbC/VirB2 family protein [Calidithermus chliarophilus]
MRKIGATVKKLAALPEVRGLLMGLLLVGLGNVAHAQADQAFNNLTTAICNIYNAMKGPFGLALVIIMFAIGGISLMIGGKKAVPLMIGAAVGGVILAAAPSFARIFVSSTSQC